MQVKSRFADIYVPLIVCLMSLSMLAYVGLGGAQRTYARFQAAKLAAQGEIIQNSMESHLLAGMPIREFVGFQPISIQILESDSTIAAMQVVDRDGRVVFENQRKDESGQISAVGESLWSNQQYEVRYGANHLIVILPLRNKFETVGQLVVVMPRAIISEKMHRLAWLLVPAVLILSIIFGWYVRIRKEEGERRHYRRQQVGLLVAFLAMTIFIVAQLTSLYSEGAQAKAKALASSLGERIGAVTEMNIDLADIDGVEKALGDYRRNNPDINAIGLSLNDNVIIHTDSSAVGKRWSTQADSFEYSVPVGGDGERQKHYVTVSLPVKVVYSAIASNIKNFAVLFFASALLAGLFLQVSNALRTNAESGGNLSESAIELCKPVLFLAVFVDNLSASFLPQLIRGSADAAAIPSGMVSVAFMAYFIFFALSLVPAGKYAQRSDPKPLIWIGALLIATGGALLATFSEFWLLVLSRILAGLGQGMLFIGAQSFALASGRKDQQRKSNAAIVYNFQAGMISGMAIGSLLVLYLGASGVFWFGCFIALAVAAYTYTLVHSEQREKPREIHQPKGRLLEALTDFDFMKTMALVGIPSKAVMTGVIIFALPLLLTRMTFEKDEIGQIIMFYAIGVLLANQYIVSVKNSPMIEQRYLTGGMFLCAVGLVFIGILGLPAMAWVLQINYLTTVGLIIGVLMVGLGQGAINAPVVTRIANSELADRMGTVNATALYRLLERFGHIAGPAIVGQLLFLGDQSLEVIGWIGAVLLVFAAIFSIQFKKSGVAHD